MSLILTANLELLALKARYEAAWEAVKQAGDDITIPYEEYERRQAELQAIEDELDQLEGVA